MDVTTYEPTAKQSLAHACNALYLLFGGAKYGGKSVWLCWEAWMLAMEYPGNRGFLGRKRAIDFRDTTFETWKREIPSETYTINEPKREIWFPATGSMIKYGGLDYRTDIEKFNSAEYGFVGIDQAEEIDGEDFAAVCGTLRILLPNKKRPHYRGLFTANPAICHLRDSFIISPPSKDYEFIQALPSDNPYLDSNYIEQLKILYRHRPELLQAYLHGSWEQLEGADIVIQRAWAEAAATRKPERKGKRLVTCDPARCGDSDTVIYAFRGTSIVGKEIYGKKDTMETAGRIRRVRAKYKDEMIYMDAIGIGAGIYDRLREVGEPVKALNASSSPRDPKKFKDLRAEMWWTTGEILASGEGSIPNDPILIGQLSSPHYKLTSGGQIQVESKGEMRKRGVPSPDRGDACVMGFYMAKGHRATASIRILDTAPQPDEDMTPQEEEALRLKRFLEAD